MKPKPVKRIARSLANYNKNAFINGLQNIEENTNSEDPNELLQHFYDKIMPIINNHAPIKLIKPKQPGIYPPWINKNLKDPIKYQNELLNTFNKNPNEQNDFIYKTTKTYCKN